MEKKSQRKAISVFVEKISVGNYLENSCPVPIHVQKGRGDDKNYVHTELTSRIFWNIAQAYERHRA